MAALVQPPLYFNFVIDNVRVVSRRLRCFFLTEFRKSVFFYSFLSLKMGEESEMVDGVLHRFAKLLSTFIVDDQVRVSEIKGESW